MPYRERTPVVYFVPMGGSGRRNHPCFFSGFRQVNMKYIIFDIIIDAYLSKPIRPGGMKSPISFDSELHIYRK